MILNQVQDGIIQINNAKTMTPELWTIFILPTDTCFGIACAFDDKKNYHKIYKIKKRSHGKPLALMVESFDWLEQYTDLSSQQIDFLKDYNKPFTILTRSSYIEMFLKFEDEEEGMFENNDIYEQIGFRVAHTPEQKKLIKKVGPIWLTSANLSGKEEIYKLKEIERQFEYYIEKWIVEVVGWKDLDPNIKPSDVFGFEGESLEQVFVRKN